MIRNSILSAILVLCFVSVSFADFQGLPEQVKSKLPAIQKYPKASSVLIWEQEKFQLQANGAQVYELHSFRYIPDEAARDNFGDPHVAYVEGEQKLEILTSRCYTKNGKKVDSTPENAFNPITPDVLQFAPQLTKFREMVITMLGLENGSIVELEYRLTTAKPLYPWMCGRVYLRETAPTLARELIVELPVGGKLNFKTGGGLPDPKVAGSTYTWTLGETAGYQSEDLGKNTDLLPNVAFTTAGDWPEIQSELKARVNKAMEGSITIPVSLAEELAGKNEPESKLIAIKEWAKDRINMLSFNHPDFPVSLRSANEILKSGYGNNLELATLISKLANQSGLTTSVMLRFEGDVPVPYIQQVSGALIEFRTNDSYFICDPVLPRNELTQSDLVGSTLMPINGAGKVSVMPLLSPNSNNLSLDVSLSNLDKDTLNGSGTFYARGQYAPYEAVRSEGANAYLEGLVNLKGLNLSDVSVKELSYGAVTISFSFTSAEALEAEGDSRVLPLSIMDISKIVKDAPTGLLKRDFPQQIHIPGEAALHVNVEMPDDWSVADQHPEISGKQAWGEYNVASSLKDGRYNFTRSMKLSEKNVPVGGWTELRHWLLGAGKGNGNVVVFSTKSAPEKTTKK